MTIDELAVGYGQSADLLRCRIGELEHAIKLTQDEQGRVQLDRRLRPLRAMYRDTRTVKRHLEGYYARRNRTTQGEQE